MSNGVLGTIIACGVSAAAIAILLKSGLAYRVIDVPNDRSLHERPTPRIGGVGILLGLMCALPFSASAATLTLTLIALVLAAVSFRDDQVSLSAGLRFGVHFLCGLVLVALFPSNLLIMVFVVFATMWLINLYNFMDGMDAFAGGMAVFGFVAYAIAAADGGMLDLASLSSALAAGSVGFLLFNWHPAKIFMGDTGATALGFLAAGIGYVGFVRGLWPFWFPPLVFSPFIADSTITLLRRMATEKRFWEAHRSHYYQRMSLVFGQPTTLWCWYVVMAVSAAAALMLRPASSIVVAVTLVLSLLFYLGAMLALERMLKVSTSKS